MNNLIKIFVGELIEAQRLASILEEDGISVFLKNNVDSALMAGFAVPQNSVELFVESDKQEDAQKILKAL